MEVGFWKLGFGSWVLDVGCLKFCVGSCVLEIVFGSCVLEVWFGIVVGQVGFEVELGLEVGFIIWVW